MSITPGHPLPIDWRYINFNSWTDHWDTTASRFHRFAPMASSGISFTDATGGLLRFSCWPVDTSRPLVMDSVGEMNLCLTGKQGFELFCDERMKGGTQYYHLLDLWRPGFRSGDSLQNSTGLCFHHTPVYIGGQGNPDFTNFANLHPSLGDGKTWMLAVDGSLLAKEIFVNDSVWADFVFDPNYQLQPLNEVESYITQHRHLP